MATRSPLRRFAAMSTTLADPDHSVDPGQSRPSVETGFYGLVPAPRRVFSGIQPTGTLHLGNYVAAIRPWVAAQNGSDMTLCVADLHALTTPESARHAPPRTKVRETAAILLACGIDPVCATLFVQSDVAAHAELAWLLLCVTPVGWLERMTQFKTRAAYVETLGTGLLAYPVLQAADILLYRAHFVPVGEDQEQHIELTREVARRFHSLFGPVFTLPYAVVVPNGARLMGLDDPSVKMSKSIAAVRKGHAIGLVDPPDEIRDAVMHAVTDSGREVRPGETSPGITNLLTIYQTLSGVDEAAVNAEFAGKRYIILKRAVADLTIAKLAPIRARYHELAGRPEAVDAVLATGADRARLAAAPTLDRVKQLIGLSGSVKRRAS
ncbi:MAG TPA: tryptophan--tRNA ligase [Gemmatimonadaceae bacterium]|nr:tryptophan--tRNA ligase [Gemmatimonadaceae bacterium]